MLAGQTAIAYGYAPTRALLDHWGVPMLMVAVWLLAIVGLMHQRHHDNDTPRPRAIPILVVAASAFVALAFALELHDQWITTAWTIQALVVLFIGLRFKELPMLWVSTALAVMVAWRLIPYPWLLEELSGGHPVFNT
ncbi:MAG: DUF2339 domain-containing protein, partial [Myxococcota bacterium]